MGGIRLDVDLPAPPDRVWPLLTDRNRMTVWFTDTDFAPESGRRFMLWPGHLPGIDGPISAVVLEVVEPRHLVMGWQGPHSQTTMTWTLQQIRNGTRLRVVETGHLGPAEAVREQTLRRLFDVNLRRLVEERVPVPAAGTGGPDVAPVSVVPVSERPSRLDTPGDVAPAPPPVVEVDPAADSRRRRRTVLIGLLALLLLAGVALWVALPARSAGGGSATLPGEGGFGSAPGTGSTGTAPGSTGAAGGAGPGGSGSRAGRGSSAGTGTGAGTGNVDPSGGASALTPTDPAGGGGPGQPGPVHLTITDSISGTLLLVNVIVTITNDGASSGTWRAATVVVGGTDLVVTSTTTDVSVVHKAPTQCFYPTQSAATVPAGGSYRFTFKITLSVALQGSPVKTVALDQAPC